MKIRRRLNKKLIKQYIKINGLTFKEFCSDFKIPPREMRRLFRRYFSTYVLNICFMARVMRVDFDDLVY